MNKTERRTRDSLVIQLFLAGHPQSSIAAHPRIRLTAPRVNQIIKAELDRCTEEHALLNEKAMTIYMARMEILIREAFSHVVDGGDLRAIETARKLLEQQAKFTGALDEDGTGGGFAPVIAPPPPDESELDEAVPVDDLTAYRMQKEAGKPS